LTTAKGELHLTYADDRPARESGAAKMTTGAMGLTWEVGDGTHGVLRWQDVTSWATLDLTEARRLRGARRRTRITVESSTGDVLTFLTDADDGRALTRMAQDRSTGGTVTRVGV
jgi:hypothetical protein